MEIIKGKIQRPQRAVWYGPEGIGKNNLLAQMPGLLLMDIEGGADGYDIARTKRVTSWTMANRIVDELIRDKQGFDTLGIDTGDWLEKLCINHICAENQMKALGGENDYGRSYSLLYNEFAAFLDKLSELRDRGMNVVILAHSQLKERTIPGEFGKFERYELKLEKKTAAMLKEWPDMLLFINHETFIVKDEKTKVTNAQGKKRYIHTIHDPCFDAKHRTEHNLPEKILFPKDGGFKAIAHCFSAGKPAGKPAAKPAASEVEDEQLPHLDPEPEPVAKKTKAEAETKAVSKPLKVDSAAFPAALFDLMDADGITEAEIQKAVAKRGYYPVDTPIGNYEQKFVDGVIVAAWPKVKALIESMRKEN